MVSIGWYYVQVFILTEKTNLVMKGHLIAAIFNFIGNLVLIPFIGILGAAIITLMTFFIQMIYFRYKSRKFYDIKLKWGFLWKSISASVIMSICIILLKSFVLQVVSIPALIVLILIGAIVYTITAALLGVFQREEYDLVKSLFSK